MGERIIHSMARKSHQFSDETSLVSDREDPAEALFEGCFTAPSVLRRIVPSGGGVQEIYLGSLGK